MAKTKGQVDQDRVKSVFDAIKNNSNEQDSLNQPYNLFTMWDMSENDHTKLLLSLLRFKQGKEYVLIKSFMKRFAIEIGIPDDNQQVEIYYNRKYVYYTENNATGNSSIDGLILIKDTNNLENNCAIIVENKIKDAPDQPNQVRRYIYHMLKQENIKLKKNIWCFYIASDGSKSISEYSYTPSYEEENDNPNKLSLKIKKGQTNPEEVDCHIEDRFIELNYKYDITSWLREDILDKRIYPESLTSAARAYLESLEKDLFNAKPYENLYQTILKAIKDSKSDTPNGDNNPLSVDNLLKEMDESDFKTLYALYDEVSKLKNEQDKKKGTDEDSSNLEELRRGIKSLISKIEQDAFDEFERCSVEILNQNYSDKLCKEGLKWQAKHRGLSGEKGFIQLRLNNGWTDAHLEWIPINTTMMYTATKYTLTLHVENNIERRNKIKHKLGSKSKVTSKSCIYNMEFHTSTSLAKMSPNDLRGFLSNDVYNEDGIKACCEAIIETV